MKPCLVLLLRLGRSFTSTPFPFIIIFLNNPPFSSQLPSSSTHRFDSIRRASLCLASGVLMGEPGSSSSSPGETERSSEQRIHPDSKFKPEPSTTFFGRHRMTAAITKLQNEINFIQEELEKLETIGGSSIVCAELIPSVESIPDPLLPVTKGPADANWDQWFRGIHSGRGHKALDLLRKREKKVY